MSNFIQLDVEPLNLSVIHQTLMSTSTGASSIFIGTTRDHFNGKRVLSLEYEAFLPMARKEMDKICSKIRTKWTQVQNIVLHHRLGRVPAGEASVIIAINSVHRGHALEAVQFAIDEIKAVVPIWKKEVYDGFSEEWKENRECQWTTSKDQVQLLASKDELDHRISAFIQRKRRELDSSNVLEFCNRHAADESQFSCARVDSIPVAHKGTTSHLRKSQVRNQPKLRKEEERSETNILPQALNERLCTLETHIAPGKPVPTDIYSRLKALEDRVLYLEGISPEYFKENQGQPPEEPHEEGQDQDDRTSKLIQSSRDINKRIQELRATLNM